MEENARSELVDAIVKAPSSSCVNDYGAGNGRIRSQAVDRAGEDWRRSKLEEASELNVFRHAAQNAARYKLMSPACLPITRSPCLTIPPGLSPTTLLDSPVLLSNMKAEPSPTTGTFSLTHLTHEAAGSDSFASPREPSYNSSLDEGSTGDFEFKPHSMSCSSSCPSAFGAMASSIGSNIQQSRPSPPSVTPEIMAVSSQDLTLSVTPASPSLYIREGATSEVTDSRSQQFENIARGNHASLSESRAQNPLADDGYNWRKYGQKHVKGSEFPRSYYKCTHPNCQVKKQLERSQDGQITEIIYKGTHDHPKPHASRRVAIGPILSRQDDERSSSHSSLITEDKPSGAQADSSGAPEIFAKDDAGAVTHSSNIGDEIEDDEDPDLKRRKSDAGFIDVTSYGKVSREPRVVVQTVSEVDILDDGYRWRKYGQKVVKGNPNPRSYYKCTNSGCPVRKHVERASHDPKAVITTYEGKHNHDVPSGRTGGNELSHDANVLSAHVPVSLCEAFGIDRFEGSDSISLDLGVGIRPNLDCVSSMEHISSSIPQTLPVYGRAIPAAPISSYPNARMDGVNHFTVSEDGGEGFGFTAPSLSCSSSLYQKLLLGP